MEDTEIIDLYFARNEQAIDEWTPEDGYVELAGSIAGSFYSVKGYDPSFMLCMKEPNGDVTTYIRKRIGSLSLLN